jgi:aspartyl protease family protein
MLRNVAVLAGLAACVAMLAPRMLENSSLGTITTANLTDNDDEEPARAPGSVTMRVGRNGHFNADAVLNGSATPVLVDTGASVVALTYEDARRLGLISPGDRWDMTVQTANGKAQAKRVKLDSVRIGGITVRNVAAVVTDKGAMTTNLLGMSFLNRLGRFEVRDGRLIMEE